MENPLKPNIPYTHQFYPEGHGAEAQAGKGPSNQMTSNAPEGTKSNKGSDPILSLPKGGGAIKGIGEKFKANPVTGTGSISIPLPISPGRGEFTPQLSLNYDSGSGNGPFGLGWSIGLPSISRKTDKGLPKYHDHPSIDGNESDTFILSGAEDLVPVLEEINGQWFRVQSEESGYRIYPYRPRIEGLFAKIERWEDIETGVSHWRATTKDNVTTIYGSTADTRIFDPDNPTHVYQWMIEQTLDNKGNVITYTYVRENPDNIEPSIFEDPRVTQAKCFTNLYLQKVEYGTPVNPSSEEPYFALVFDYGERSDDSPLFEPQNDWLARIDSFSTYRAGFEIRTYRLCRKILMFHRIGALSNMPVLVKIAELTYDERSDLTLLTGFQISGYDDSGKLSYPPVEFSYTEATMGQKVQRLDLEDLKNFTNGANGESFQWLDLYGEGVSGIFIQNPQAWYYKPNLGDKRYFDPPQTGQDPGPDATLGALTLIHDRPSLATPGDNSQQLGDIDGNGQTNLRILSSGISGYYEIDKKDHWQALRPFKSIPGIDMNDPNLRMIDLTGDGHADILITEQQCFTAYYSMAKDGFAPALRFSKAMDEKKGPALVFADGTQSIYLADLSGDGLTDLVRIRNGSVDYWPNLGYGRFGQKVSMENAPTFGGNDQFDQNRIRLADVDGTGTTDIIYLGTNNIRYWRNLAGNSWSEAIAITHFPNYNKLLNISVMDLLGNGTSCIVAASSAPTAGAFKVQYLELTGGKKPFLLNEMKNNLGAITRLGYAPSTKFYFRDKMNGKPWISKLPFPVHVVERVETYDGPTDSRYVTRYAYHHGYFDGVEREFRGFGMVEQWDTEHYELFPEGNLFHTASNEEDEESNVPPVYSKTWFHTGFYMEGAQISQHYSEEYFSGDPDGWFLPDTILPSSIARNEIHEACRALKGSILHQEVYFYPGVNCPSEWGGEQEGPPYTVSEKSYSIRCLQPRSSNRHAVFHVREEEAINYNYERNPNDPRISHSMVLETDDFGNVTKSAKISYARRPNSLGIEGQSDLLVQYDESKFINIPQDTSFYRLGVPCEQLTWQLHGLETDVKLSIAALLDALTGIEKIPNHDILDNKLQLRLLSCIRLYYYNEDCTDSLPFLSVASHGLLYNTKTMVFSSDCLDLISGKNDSDNNLLPSAGNMALLLNESYFEEDSVIDFNYDQFFKKSDRKTYDPDHFFLQNGLIDAINDSVIPAPQTTIEYDSFFLLPTQVTNPLDESVTATNDYRILKPWMITDINGNRQAVKYDALGMIIQTAVMGKDGANEGDSPDDPTTFLFYDLFEWKNYQRPAYVHISARTIHQDPECLWLDSYTYSNGLSQEIQTKVQAEDGTIWQMNGSVAEQVMVYDRWVVTGLTVKNNKGLIVKQYESWFSGTHQYESLPAPPLAVVNTVMHYDPLGRLIRTDFPDGSFSKVAFDAWKQENWDRNDTVLESEWYLTMQSSSQENEQRAASLAGAHAETPQVIDFDVLGRPFLITDNNDLDSNSASILFRTRKKLDIAGHVTMVTDAKNREMTHNVYDMTGLLLYTENIDSGKRWILYDLSGKPLKKWDNLNNEFSYLYDVIQRPTNTMVKEDGSSTAKLTEQIIYGTDAVHNLKGKPQYINNQTGITSNTKFDFKGNLIIMIKSFSTVYNATIDWNLPSASPIETFESDFEYDAMNRLIRHTKPDLTIEEYSFNKAGLLETISVQIRGNSQPYDFITGINYNEKGQRTDVYFGNGSKTRYNYDEHTFRLTRLLTTRNTGADILQDLNYTYDPEGNIVQVTDNAQQTLYFRNTEILPEGLYEYDPLYRLTSARGRELANLQMPSGADFANNMPVPNNNDNALQNYRQVYEYDELGNILVMSSDNWRRPIFLRGRKQPATET